jgi:hypothetical protein
LSNKKLLKTVSKKTNTCEILVFHNSVVEDSSLLGHNACHWTSSSKFSKHYDPLEHKKLLTQNSLINHRPESSSARNKYFSVEIQWQKIKNKESIPQE